jgi:ABC-type transport system involved in cytochrome c biogenesis permease subunit
MSPAHQTSGHDRDRISALAVGLTVTIASLMFAGAFAPDQLESVSRYSPWLYGPAATAAWALFSLIAYLLISRGRGQRAALDSHPGYGWRELATAPKRNGCSLCANQKEKNRLAAVTAGFALTLTAWVAVLSFMPDGWLDWLGKAPPWIYCLTSVVIWAGLSTAMYLIFRASYQKTWP